MSFEADVQELLGGIRIGTRDQRNRLRACLNQFFTSMGYTAELGSFNNGTLLIHAAPAEHALLRYDVNNLRQYLSSEGFDSLVEDIKIRTKPIAA